MSTMLPYGIQSRIGYTNFPVIKIFKKLPDHHRSIRQFLENQFVAKLPNGKIADETWARFIICPSSLALSGN